MVRKQLLFVAFVVLLAHSAAAQTPERGGPLTRAAHLAIAAHLIAQTADVSSTEFALGTGRFEEHNPLLRWASHDPIPMALAKGGYTAATSYLLLRLHHQHPKLALGCALASTAVTAWVAHQNAQSVRATGR